MLVNMFRRKPAADIEGKICPYCEFVNPLDAVQCSQCYYDLNKSARDQGEAVSQEVSNSIFDELMSEEDDSWQEGDALDVVLTLDQDPLEVEQYEATDFESEEPEKIDFVSSSSPELHSTVSHEPEEITADDIGEAIENVEKIDFSKVDPFAEVKEPVHRGKGTVFSPSTPSKLDDDLLGHVGGSELPSLPPEDLYENRIDFTSKKAPPPTPEVALPALPNFDKLPDSKPVAPSKETRSQPEESLVVAPKVAPPIEAFRENVPENTSQQSTPEPESSADEDVSSETVDVMPSESEDPRIWPWPESEAWDARQVHREVVTALEQVKSGKISEATTIIDNLGPHLTNDNIDLIYHIGMVLKQIGRTDSVKSMLEKANIVMPGNEHVASAQAHLGI